MVIRLHRHSLQLSVAAILNVKQGAQLLVTKCYLPTIGVRHEDLAGMNGLVRSFPMISSARSVSIRRQILRKLSGDVCGFALFIIRHYFESHLLNITVNYVIKLR